MGSVLIGFTWNRAQGKATAEKHLQTEAICLLITIRTKDLA